MKKLSANTLGLNDRTANLQLSFTSIVKVFQAEKASPMEKNFENKLYVLLGA